METVWNYRHKIVNFVSGFYFLIVILKMTNIKIKIMREKLSKPFWAINNIWHWFYCFTYIGFINVKFMF